MLHVWHPLLLRNSYLPSHQTGLLCGLHGVLCISSFCNVALPCSRRERDPATPKDSSAGGGPEAFSFPVTPPSEPAPPPTAVFNSWSSFKQSLRPRGSRREGVPDGGSECTTDDEGGDPARWSTLSNKSSTGGTGWQQPQWGVTVDHHADLLTLPCSPCGTACSYTAVVQLLHCAPLQ